MLSLSIDDLYERFESVIKYPIALKRPAPLSMLTISGYPNHENVWSNIYRYFLSAHDSGLSRLFLFALQDCIPDRDLNMESWIVDREAVTEKMGRIDIVIREDQEATAKVILIENKIYHALENDLDDYYNSFKKYADRTLVVLTLHPTPVKEPFINVTHQQWMGAVKSRLGGYFQDADLRQLAFLQDFIGHVDSFYHKPLEMEAYKFLFDNADKINALNQLQNEAKAQLQKEVLEHLPVDWEPYRASGSSIPLRKKETGFVLYVTMDGLFKFGEHHYSIQMWLRGESLVTQWKIAAEFQEVEDGISIHRNQSTKEWTLIGSKRYAINLDGILTFGPLINSQISGEWTKFCSRVSAELA